MKKSLLAVAIKLPVLCITVLCTIWLIRTIAEINVNPSINDGGHFYRMYYLATLLVFLASSVGVVLAPISFLLSGSRLSKLLWATACVSILQTQAVPALIMFYFIGAFS